MQSSDRNYLLNAEHFLLSLALEYISLDPEEIDQKLRQTLQKLTEYLQVDRGYIYQIKDKNSRLVLTHHYTPKGIKGKIRQHEQVDREDFHWLMHKILNKKSVLIEKPGRIRQRIIRE